MTAIQDNAQCAQQRKVKVLMIVISQANSEIR